MNRANACELRRAIAASNALIKCGIDFVLMPVLSDEDKKDLVAKMQERLEKVELEKQND